MTAPILFFGQGNRVEQRVIRLGEATGDFYNVIEGLSGGESAAVTGWKNCAMEIG